MSWRSDKLNRATDDIDIDIEGIKKGIEEIIRLSPQMPKSDDEPCTALALYYGGGEKYGTPFAKAEMTNGDWEITAITVRGKVEAILRYVLDTLKSKYPDAQSVEEGQKKEYGFAPGNKPFWFDLIIERLADYGFTPSSKKFSQKDGFQFDRVLEDGRKIRISFWQPDLYEAIKHIKYLKRTGKDYKDEDIDQYAIIDNWILDIFEVKDKEDGSEKLVRLSSGPHPLTHNHILNHTRNALRDLGIPF